MKFTEVSEMTIKQENHDFSTSFFDFLRRSKVRKMQEYSYKKKSSTKSSTGLARIVVAEKKIPVYSSNQEHPFERAMERFNIDDLELNKIIDQALAKIVEMGLHEGGFRVEKKSLGMIIPILIYKNQDIKRGDVVYYKGGTGPINNFKECPQFWAIIRTILPKTMKGAEHIKLYSRPDIDTVGVLGSHTEVIIERRSIESFTLIEL